MAMSTSLQTILKVYFYVVAKKDLGSPDIKM